MAKPFEFGDYNPELILETMSAYKQVGAPTVTDKFVRMMIQKCSDSIVFSGKLYILELITPIDGTPSLNLGGVKVEGELEDGTREVVIAGLGYMIQEIPHLKDSIDAVSKEILG